jgi:DNA-binding CsgD family transcriptional regulator
MNYHNFMESVGEDVRATARSGVQSQTARETEVLRRIVSAKSSRETAEELGISPRTVEVHRSRVMRKMGARNVADLVRIVAQL